MGMYDGGIGRKLWIKCRRESLLCTYTPFFLSLASAHLDSDSFLHCVSHDLHFCRAFVEGYKMAEECADDEDEKSALRKLRRSVKEKLKNYRSLVREWGFELREEGDMDVAAVKYRDFLLATASGKIEGEKAPGNIATPFERTKVAAYTLAAMAPCLRLYTFICQEINRLLNPDDTHVYKKWINHYSSRDFEESALQIEEMLEKLSISLTSEELEVIEKIYHQAMKLQVDFFSNLPVSGRTMIPLYQEQATAINDLIMFCDFDMTCSFVDSSAMLAEIAILTAPKSDSSGSETQLTRMSSTDLRNTWGLLSEQYAREFDQCVESIIVPGERGTFNYDSLRKALEELADFEKRANLRVIESGVLKGINLDDIRRAGQRLIIQDGCKRFSQKIADNENLNAEVHVLSYCWCGDLIRSAFSSADVDALKVHSNELAYEESVSTGDMIKTMESPMEKLHTFNEILNNHTSDSLGSTIYIGGSVGDLLCLLKADIGIVFGTSPSLRKLGHHFGITFVPLFSGLVKKQKELAGGGTPDWKQPPGVLYTVSDWTEIQALILGS